MTWSFHCSWGPLFETCVSLWVWSLLLKLQRSLWSCSYVRACVYICMPGCTCAREVRGFPICVEWGVIFPMGCSKERRHSEEWWRGGFKEATGKDDTTLFVIYTNCSSTLWQQCDFCLSFSFLRTLNNNNISSIPVSSFNHMPKLRTL